jgi:hypothetical protein
MSLFFGLHDNVVKIKHKTLMCLHPIYNHHYKDIIIIIFVQQYLYVKAGFTRKIPRNPVKLPSHRSPFSTYMHIFLDLLQSLTIFHA